MLTIPMPAPAALRAAAFSLLSASPAIDPCILRKPVAHRAAVRALLLVLAAEQEVEPGPLEFEDGPLEIEEGADGVPLDVFLDAWRLAGGRLAA